MASFTRSVIFGWTGLLCLMLGRTICVVAGQPSVGSQSFASAPLVGGFLSSGGSTSPDRPIGSQPNSGLASSRSQSSRCRSSHHRASAVRSSGSPDLAVSSPSACSSGSLSSGRSRPDSGWCGYRLGGSSFPTWCSDGVTGCFLCYLLDCLAF